MPIDLYTGQPGNGKTALMVERLIQEAKAGQRPIFSAGIEGLQPGLATDLPDPRKWNEKDESGNYIVPDGSLIFIDEAWKWFGHLHDASRQATPKWVLDLAEHRHRGLDFVWTTQQPNQLYPFVRGLIASHSHVVRRFGTKFIDVFRWGELNEDVKSLSKRDLAQRTTRMLPSQVFGSYKSAEIHTIKPRLPWKVVALPAMVLAAVVLAWLAYARLRPDTMAASLTGDAAQAAPAAATLGPQDSRDGDRRSGPRWDSAADYLQAHTPRIGPMPWTAPVFDGRSTTADPQLYCMSSERGRDARGEQSDGGCTCITEQGTAYHLGDAQCRRLARRGPAYNPYKQPLQQASAAPAQAAAATTPAVSASPGAVIESMDRALGTFPENPAKKSTLDLGG